MKNRASPQKVKSFKRFIVNGHFQIKKYELNVIFLFLYSIASMDSSPFMDPSSSAPPRLVRRISPVLPNGPHDRPLHVRAGVPYPRDDRVQDLSAGIAPAPTAATAVAAVDQPPRASTAATRTTGLTSCAAPDMSAFTSGFPRRMQTPPP